MTDGKTASSFDADKRAIFPIAIRPEEPDDHMAIRHVHTLAFGRANEADLVDALRRADALTISLVAAKDGDIIAHIAFSHVILTSSTAALAALGLAPMAVRPDRQRQGIGSQLVEAGLRICREAGYGLVVVLGHPDYYPRFGFVPAKPHGIVWEPHVPDDVFMVKELQAGMLTQTQGVVTYHPEFDRV